jgi:Phosphoglycerate dehydrogenase and related dehydrogenases
VSILGFGEIGRRVATDLALLGFPVMAWSRTEKPTPQGVRGFHGAQASMPCLARPKFS